jgi:hypothetical protein
MCVPITAQSLEITAVDCGTVWPALQATGAFPDVFAGSGTETNLCYKSTGPAAATIGGVPVTITSVISGWTTDYVPFTFGGTSDLGTAVTKVVIAGPRGYPLGQLFTRDTIDFGQLATTGSAYEEDVIVGGAPGPVNPKGTYRLQATPEDATASTVALSNLSGELCVSGPLPPP